ncbi:P-type conjugative transfer protein TrbJ [Erythrobacter rubeus]|uniref:P-type conjugative transfer protein TrbJ n=1 Tax=Erythrobacter rubeus TaxID=2760803 RepID=A0ABR8KU84_9SPHN|nr:P-type conjugative transfer protein TrbJ [Erythrobacter rubeus]MBD2843524.1 P-type conjugative transfer protein TrbJ [Erythrobacter rubeus]
MKKLLIASLVGIAVLGSGSAALLLPAAPARAIPVFDAKNYAQNLLTAARTLQQINQQIEQLQNEAQMLANQARNLTQIDFPELDRLRAKLQEIDRLMGQAQGIDFRLDTLDQRFRQLFPAQFNAMTQDQQVVEARERLDASMDGFRQAMGVQSQIVANVQEDAQALDAIIRRSQGAEGSLQAQQATNQLLALTAKQQFQLQQLMAAQFRSEAVESARRVQESQEARAATKRFLGEGRAYTPRN